MKISVELILEMLCGWYTDWETGIRVSSMNDEYTAANSLLEKCCLFSKAAALGSEVPLSAHTLWFCQSEELETVSAKLLKGYSFLTYGSEEAFDRLSVIHCCNLLFLPKQADPAQVYNQIASFFFRIYRWEADMEMVLANNGNIQNLLNTAQGLITHPIIIWNPSFESLACLNCESVGDRMPMSDMIKNGSFSGKTIKRIIEMGYLNDVNKYDHITLVYPPNWANCPFAIRAFSHQNRNVATMAQYYFNGSPTLGHLELLAQLEQYLERYTIQIPRSAVETNKRLYEPFLIDLLENRLQAEPDVQDRLQYVRLPYSSEFLLLEIQLAYFSAPLVAYAINNCKALFAHSKVISHAERIFVLIYQEHREGSFKLLRSKQVEDLRMIMETVNGICGCSQPFETLLQLHDARQECEAVLKAAKLLEKKQRFYRFSEYVYYCILEINDTRDGLPLKNLIIKPIRQLYAASKETGNDNIELLDYYLNHNCNITDTSKKMNLHRNSVIYRLGRINDHLNGALDDPEQRFQTTAMLKLLHLPVIRRQLEQELELPRQAAPKSKIR